MDLPRLTRTTNDFHRLMVFPVKMHIQDNPTKDTSPSERDVVLLLLARAFQEMLLFHRQYFRIVFFGGTFWDVELSELLDQPSFLAFCLMNKEKQTKKDEKCYELLQINGRPQTDLRG